jgi:hypothetical protein
MRKTEKEIAALLFSLLTILLIAQAAFAWPMNTGMDAQKKNYDKDHPRDVPQKDLDCIKCDPSKATNEKVAKALNDTEQLRSIDRNDPKNVAQNARAGGQAQATGAGNAAGDIAKNEAIEAIDYASRFLVNFTTQGGFCPAQ